MYYLNCILFQENQQICVKILVNERKFNFGSAGKILLDVRCVQYVETLDAGLKLNQHYCDGRKPLCPFLHYIF